MCSPARRAVPLAMRLAPRGRGLLRRDARLAVRLAVVPVHGAAATRRAVLRPMPRRAVSRR